MCPCDQPDGPLPTRRPFPYDASATRSALVGPVTRAGDQLATSGSPVTAVRREIAQRCWRRGSSLGRSSRVWARSTLRVWAWLQLVLPWLARGSLLLSMTSRAPWWRRRHVMVVHDLFVLTNPEWFSRLYYLTHAPLLRTQIRSAAAIVAVSEPTAEALRAIHSGPIVVAPNAASTSLTTLPNGPRLRCAARSAAKTSTSLFASAALPRKTRPARRGDAALDTSVRGHIHWSWRVRDAITAAEDLRWIGHTADRFLTDA